jgi:hypothetical protein
MRRALTTATVLGGSPVGATPGQQSTQVVLPSVFQFVTRRAGIGPGGFQQLCDDPLDPRLTTGECSAANIAQ